MPSNPPPDDNADERVTSARRTALRYLGATGEREVDDRLARRFLLGALVCAVVVPLLFYLRFGELGPFAWGFTVFLVVLCLLFALGLYISSRPAYHTQVAMRNDWLDRLGAFWLLACAGGPLLGGLVTLFPVTESDWRWRYVLRVALALGLPVLTGLPLLRYIRGRAALLAVPLLLGITALPALTAIAPLRDLFDGPVERQVRIVEEWEGSCLPVDGQPLGAPCPEGAGGRPGEVVTVQVLRRTHRVLEQRISKDRRPGTYKPAVPVRPAVRTFSLLPLEALAGHNRDQPVGKFLL